MSLEYTIAGLEQGSTYRKKFIIKNRNPETQVVTLCDLTGFTARMKVRAYETPMKVALDLTTENHGIMITLAEASINLYVPASHTAMLAKKYHYHYDLELVKVYSNLPEPEVFKLIHGPFVLKLEETTW